MKKLVITLALVGACVSAMAQGTINFANAAPGLNQPIWLGAIGAPNAKPSGNAYTVQLLWGPAGSTEAQLINSVAPAFFNTGAASGYFAGGSRTLDGAAGGVAVSAMLVAWNSAAGATWDIARLSAGLAESGKSAIFSVTPTVAPATPAVMTALTSFAIVAVPEPTTMALAGLGAAALLIFRRRK